MRELDYMAIDAAMNEGILNQFTKQNEKFILKCASKATGRFVTQSDDEWSIALIAFTHSVQSYQLEKGSFFPFAELVIRRRLIDYFRNQEKYKLEISVNPSLFDSELEEEDENLAIRLAVAEQVSKQEGTSLKLEIEAANEIFERYGFSFYDLTECSPKAEKTKISCAKAVIYILHNPLIVEELHRSKLLPLKIIEKNAKVPRKILERHRKYIIAAVEILSGEYPYLAEYMHYIRKEI